MLILQQYTDFVKPSFDEYIAPTQTKADIIIPNGEDSTGNIRQTFLGWVSLLIMWIVVAIDLIVQHISMKLQRQGDLREQFLSRNEENEVMPDNLIKLPENKQILVIIIAHVDELKQYLLGCY